MHKFFIEILIKIYTIQFISEYKRHNHNIYYVYHFKNSDKYTIERNKIT